jgi:N-acyl-D-amino-acid deacylase
MEAIEDIPGTALAEGLQWDWESFPEYLDALDRMPRTIDIGAQIPRRPLRVFVMGDRGINHEAATEDDVAEMRRLTEAALRAGAFGFSFTTSRIYSHKTNAGDLVPGHFAEEAELCGVGQAMASVGNGAFGMNSDFIDEDAEFAWMTRLSRETGRPVWFVDGPHQGPGALEALDQARPYCTRERGADHCAGRRAPRRRHHPGHRRLVQPVLDPPELSFLERLSPRERLEQMRPPRDPRPAAQRGTIGAAAGSVVAGATEHGRPLGQDVRDERRNPRLRAVSREEHCRYCGAGQFKPTGSRLRLLDRRAGQILFFPIVNYTDGDHETVREMLTDPGTLLGLSDGGVHCGAIVDASVTSFMLAHWGRDRSRGPGLPLPQLVKMQSSETADFFGFSNRGHLAPGLRADLNLVDFDRLRLLRASCSAWTRLEILRVVLREGTGSPTLRSDRGRVQPIVSDQHQDCNEPVQTC